MPVKPLPKKLVNRLRASVKKSRRKKTGRIKRAQIALGNMKNIDPRSGYIGKRKPLSTDDWGDRVRQMNVSRNFPGVELVVKRVHTVSAKRTITIINKKIANHNKKFRSKNYKLLYPKAYVIGKELVAMSKLEAPNLYEVTNKSNNNAIAMFRKIKSELKISAKELNSLSSTIMERTNIKRRNFLVLGVENGKIVLMPAIDIN